MDEQSVRRVYALFNEFHDSHAAFQRSCRINELFYMGDHWTAAGELGIPGAGSSDVQPVTPVLFSTLDNLESDLGSGRPEAVYLPARLSGRRAADELTQIVGQTLDNSDFDTAYRRWIHDALVCGTGILQTSCAEGEQARVDYIDVCGFMADPVYEDIQDGRACFKYTRVRQDWLEQHYPERAAKAELDADSLLGPRPGAPSGRKPDEAALIEYWKREYDAKSGKWRVHMALLAGGVLLEDSRELFPDGYYDHGLYPFAALSPFPKKGTYLGFSLIEVFSTMQIYSDKLDQIVLINAALGGNPRMLVNTRANIDLKALCDPRQKVITGDLIDSGALRQLDVPPIPQATAQLAASIRNTLKEESGQNQFGRGEGGRGITAASAIQAMQEASGKRSMKLERHVHSVFKNCVARQLVELIRQFYDCGEFFPVTGELPGGERGQYEVGISQGRVLRFFPGNAVESADMPSGLFVKTRVQRARVYDSQYYNDFALRLLQTGAVALPDVIGMMQFEGRDELKRALEERGV